jgi:hypothetical protein
MCGVTSHQPVVTATSLPRLVPGAGFSVHCNRPSGFMDVPNSGRNNCLLKRDYTACSYHIISTIYNIYTNFFLTQKYAILKLMWALQNIFIH